MEGRGSRLGCDVFELSRVKSSQGQRDIPHATNQVHLHTSHPLPARAPEILERRDAKTATSFHPKSPASDQVA